MRLCVADISVLLSMSLGPVLRYFGLSSRLDEQIGNWMAVTATLGFMALHLPLSERLRQDWNWSPQSGLHYMKAVERREATLSPRRTGRLARWVPSQTGGCVCRVMGREEGRWGVGPRDSGMDSGRQGWCLWRWPGVALLHALPQG